MPSTTINRIGPTSAAADTTLPHLVAALRANVLYFSRLRARLNFTVKPLFLPRAFTRGQIMEQLMMTLDHWMTRLGFFAMCVVTALLVLMLGRALWTRRSGKRAAVTNRLLAFLMLAIVGDSLASLANYRMAYGSGHPVVVFVILLGAFCALGAGFWVNRQDFIRTHADFIAANGGTRRLALASLLLHPGRSMLRLQKKKVGRAPSAPPPEV